jgi:hypothetical protein
VLIPATTAPISLDLDLPDRQMTEGSALAGVVLAEAVSDLRALGCEVALVRTTSYVHGQGAIYGGSANVPIRTTEVVEARGLPCAGPLRAGDLLTLPFSMEIPASGPGTVSASLVQVQWAVRARMKADGSPPAETTRPFVVLSRASEQAAVADEPPTTVDRGLAALRFVELSSRRLVPGSAITGLLTLDALKTGVVRGLRVELLLREEVHRGRWIGDDPARNPANEAREAETVVARQVIADRIEMDPGGRVVLPFQLHAPRRLASPSLATDQFTLSWILRGVADRALRPDPHVEVALHGATTAGEDYWL